MNFGRRIRNKIIAFLSSVKWRLSALLMLKREAGGGRLPNKSDGGDRRKFKKKPLKGTRI